LSFAKWAEIMKNKNQPIEDPYETEEPKSTIIAVVCLVIVIVGLCILYAFYPLNKSKDIKCEVYFLNEEWNKALLIVK
jgi:hypothetical protein